jgi:hypothetical protein
MLGQLDGFGRGHVYGEIELPTLFALPDLAYICHCRQIVNSGTRSCPRPQQAL